MDDIFDMDTIDSCSDDFDRDQWGRPLVIMPDGSIAPHARVSTISGLATNAHGLRKHDECQAAIAIARCPDIAAILSGMDYSDDAQKSKISALVKEARTRCGSTIAANWGTAVHLHSQIGATRAFLPGVIREDVESIRVELERTGISALESEVKIVNSAHDLMVAGTFDTLYRIPSGVVITLQRTGQVINLSDRVIVGDSKTGKIRNVNVAAQLAGYSYGERYAVRTGDRTPIHPDLERRVGLSVHIPRGEGRTEFGFIDLEGGRELLAAARTLHRMSDGRTLTLPVPDVQPYVRILAECVRKDDVRTAYLEISGTLTDPVRRTAFRAFRTRIGELPD